MITQFDVTCFGVGHCPDIYAFAMGFLREIEKGLWRWTAPHPEWRAGARPESPADWPRDVGCVLCRLPRAIVLIDPLLPPQRNDFLHELDPLVRQPSLRVFALTTIGFHRRSRAELIERYQASTSRARRALPREVEPLPIRGAGETMFWFPDHAALVPGDRLLGAPGGGLRLCPESWLGYLSSGMTLPTLRERLLPLLELPVERVLVSHGAPVLSDGRSAIAEAPR
jgi:hypothetical protein